MGGQKPDNFIDVDPDLTVAFLLAFIKNQLHAEMEVDDFNVVGVFPVGISGAPHETDQVTGIDCVSHCQTGSKGCVLLQVGIVIVPPPVKGANAYPPAAVAVPPHGFHDTALHRGDGRSESTHQVIAQVLPAEAEGAAHTKVVAVAVAVSCRNGGEGFQPVAGNVCTVLPDGVTAHKPAQHGTVGFPIVVVVFGKSAQKLLGSLVGAQVGSCLPDRRKPAFSAGAAGGKG